MKVYSGSPRERFVPERGGFRHADPRDPSIIFAEFDGPRKREITVQVIGE